MPHPTLWARIFKPPRLSENTLMRNMGASCAFLVWKTVSVLKLSGVRHAWNFFNAWRRAEVLESAGGG